MFNDCTFTWAMEDRRIRVCHNLSSTKNELKCKLVINCEETGNIMNICIRYSWKRLRDISCSFCMLILLYVVFVVSCFCCFVSGRGKHNRLLRSNVDILIFRWVMWPTAFLIFFKKWHRLFFIIDSIVKDCYKLVPQTCQSVLEPFHLSFIILSMSNLRLPGDINM